MSQNSETGIRPLTHNMHFEITLTQGESSWAIKWLTWILKKGSFPSKYIVSLTCCCCCIASVVSDSVRPHRWQPTRLFCPWDSPGKNTGVGCHFLLQCMHACMLSCFSRVWLYATLWTAAHQAPLSTGFSRQEYWSGLPFQSIAHSNC